MIDYEGVVLISHTLAPTGVELWAKYGFWFFLFRVAPLFYGFYVNFFGHFNSLISMIWGHHQLENSRKWGGRLNLKGRRQVPKQVSKFWAALQEFLTFSRQVRFYCSGAKNFENLHGSLSQPIFDRNVERSSKFQYRRWGLCCQISKITQSRWKDFGWKMENHGA